MCSNIFWENKLETVKTKNKKSTYIFATDIVDKTINYTVFLNFSTINEHKNIQNLINEDNHIYEVITKDTVKINFDIDNLDLSREQTDSFLLDFVNIVNNELDIKLTTDKLIVMCNDKKNKKTGEYSDAIHSLHNIIPSYKINKKQQKLFAKYLNDVYDDI
jgi:hypothetical protein